MGASAEGGNASRVQFVCDRLKGLAVRAHPGDALMKPGPVGHCGTAGQTAVGPSRREASARSFGQLASLELSGCRQGAERDLAGLGVRIETEAARHQAPAVVVEPADQRAHRGGRGPEAVEAIYDQARGLARGDLLQDVAQAGPLRMCAGHRLQIAYHGDQLQPTCLARAPDRLGLAGELGLSRSVRAGASRHVAERASVDGRQSRVVTDPTGRRVGSVLHQLV